MGDDRGITSREIEAILAAHGTWKAGPLLLEDRWALALIDRAEKHRAAIVSVAHRSPEARGHTVYGGNGTALGLVIYRADSWSQARDFIRSLQGRGLLFEIALEEQRRTRGGRFADRTVPFWAWSALFELLFLALFLVAAILMAKMDQTSGQADLSASDGSPRVARYAGMAIAMIAATPRMAATNP